MKKVIKMYLHSDKEDNWDLAQELGISEEAYREHFKYTLYEVECEVEVDTETGESKLLSARET